MLLLGRCFISSLSTMPRKMKAKSWVLPAATTAATAATKGPLDAFLRPAGVFKAPELSGSLGALRAEGGLLRPSELHASQPGGADPSDSASNTLSRSSGSGASRYQGSRAR